MSANMNPYIRKTLYVISIVIILVLLLVLKKNHDRQICEHVDIEIKAPIEKQLVTESLVKDKLEKWYSGGLSGVAQSDMSLADIESRLKKITSVKNAEVSFDLRGELRIDIEQRLPVVRIINGKRESYYIAKDGTEIPVSETDVARVPIANGDFSSTMIRKVYTLSTYVHENEFMEALVEQIFVNNKGDLVIVPKVKNQQIIVGDTADIEKKFTKLIDFYTNGLNHIGWDKYRTINLKYKDQIVCK